MQTTSGPPVYVSPEIIREEPYTATADIQAAGVLLYAMVCNGFPFDGESITALVQMILTKTLMWRSYLSGEIRRLLGGMITKDLVARISMNAILEYPWLSEEARVIPPMENGELPLSGDGIACTRT
jgi:serine/threonine protein kinase